MVLSFSAQADLAPPAIIGQPQNLSAFSGVDATLSIEVSGDLFPGFQWYSNGMLLAEQTNSLFLVTHLEPGNVAQYHVVVANSLGKATRNVAAVTVKPWEDPSFQLQVKGAVQALLLQPDGKILAAEDFTLNSSNATLIFWGRT